VAALKQQVGGRAGLVAHRHVLTARGRNGLLAACVSRVRPSCAKRSCGDLPVHCMQPWPHGRSCPIAGWYHPLMECHTRVTNVITLTGRRPRPKRVNAREINTKITTTHHTNCN
jgi:hypothetical protein